MRHFIRNDCLTRFVIGYIKSNNFQNFYDYMFYIHNHYNIFITILVISPVCVYAAGINFMYLIKEVNIKRTRSDLKVVI